MTANEITDRLILDNQNLVVEELMRHDESLLDSLQNFDENSEIMEWWLVTPYMAELLKEKGEVILSDYDCCWWGRQTSGQALYMDGVIQEIAEQMLQEHGKASNLIWRNWRLSWKFLIIFKLFRRMYL